MGSEELYIKAVENGIRAIKLGTKTPQEANVAFSLNGLKNINEGMHQELMEKYKKVVEDYNKKNPKK